MQGLQIGTYRIILVFFVFRFLLCFPSRSLYRRLYLVSSFLHLFCLVFSFLIMFSEILMLEFTFIPLKIK